MRLTGKKKKDTVANLKSQKAFALEINKYAELSDTAFRSGNHSKALNQDSLHQLKSKANKNHYHWIL